jgi:hypothetical protein
MHAHSINITHTYVVWWAAAAAAVWSFKSKWHKRGERERVPYLLFFYSRRFSAA